jgi:hypothetical protein
MARYDVVEQAGTVADGLRFRAAMGAARRRSIEQSDLAAVVRQPGALRRRSRVVALYRAGHLARPIA